jgi:hypothetical protein
MKGRNQGIGRVSRNVSSLTRLSSKNINLGQGEKTGGSLSKWIIQAHSDNMFARTRGDNGVKQKNCGTRSWTQINSAKLKYNMSTNNISHE